MEGPNHAMRTYISENALSPNFANLHYLSNHAEVFVPFFRPFSFDRGR